MWLRLQGEKIIFPKSAKKRSGIGKNKLVFCFLENRDGSDPNVKKVKLIF